MSFISGHENGFPNELINPFFEFDQANEGAVMAGAAKLVDSWLCQTAALNGAAIATARVTVGSLSTISNPIPFPYALKHTLTTSASVLVGTYDLLSTRLEAQQLTPWGEGLYRANTFTAALWLAASFTGTFGVYISMYDGGATNYYFTTVTLAAANQWQLFPIVIPGETRGFTLVDSGSPAFAVELGLVLAGGSTYQGTAGAWGQTQKYTTSGQTQFTTKATTDWVAVGPVKLERGFVPTPINRGAIDAELRRAQRYYWKTYDLGTAPGAHPNNNGCIEWVAPGTIGLIPIRFPTQIANAAVGTITPYSPQSGASGNVYDVTGAADVAASAVNVGQQGCGISFTAVAGRRYRTHLVVDARL